MEHSEELSCGKPGLGAVVRGHKTGRSQMDGMDSRAKRNQEHSAAIESQVGDLELLSLKRGLEKLLHLSMFIMSLSRTVLLQGLSENYSLVYMNKLCPEANFLSDSEGIFTVWRLYWHKYKHNPIV